MKSCHHPSFKWVHDEDLGDRTLKHYRCRACGHPRTRNVKKPRYTTRKLPEVATPAKRSKTSQKPPVRKRKAIPAVSAKRKGWLKQYEAKKRADDTVVQGFHLTEGRVLSVPMFKAECEPHHGLARLRCRILFYAWTSPALHKAIHDNPKWAREQGLLLPEYDGRESGPDQKDPLNLLPAYRAYLAEHGLK